MNMGKVMTIVLPSCLKMLKNISAVLLYIWDIVCSSVSLLLFFFVFLGLGKKKEGRVEPVMAVVLPKGKSLDECADFTQRRTKGKAAKDSPLTGRPKKRRKPRAARGGQNNVFDFLNHKLGGGGNCHTEEGAAATSTATGVEAYTGAGNTKKNLNVKVFQAAQRVSQTEKEIHRLSEALRRHTGGLVLTTVI